MAVKSFVDEMGYPHLVMVLNPEDDPHTGHILSLSYRYWLEEVFHLQRPQGVRIAKALFNAHIYFTRDIIKVANRQAIFDILKAGLKNKTQARTILQQWAYQLQQESPS